MILIITYLYPIFFRAEDLIKLAIYLMISIIIISFNYCYSSGGIIYIVNWIYIIL